MEKLQLVVHPPAGVGHARLKALLLGESAPRLLELQPGRLKVSVTAAPPPRATVIPLGRQPVGLVTIEADAVGEAQRWRQALGIAGGRVAGYLVEESIPVPYTRTWADGERTPGVDLLTLFRRRRGLDDATFLARWHGSHTPLSLRIHPLWGYVRNLVRAAALPGSPPLDGIVEEHFRSRADLTQPWRFFGGPLSMLPNMLRVAVDISRFIDLASLRTFLVEEHIVRG